MTTEVKNVNKTGPELKDVFIEFAKWSVMTKKERQAAKLPTAKSFADKYDLHPSQLSRWKQREDFRMHKEEYQREKLQELTPDVLGAFFNRCIKYGMSSDIELWLALVERWDKKKVIEHKEIRFGLNDVRVLTANLTPERQKYYHVTLAKLLAEATDAEEKARNTF